MTKLENLVYDYPTKYHEGFIQTELNEILLLFPDINKDRFWNAMKGNTCIMKEGQIVTYHCDVLTALICGIENRDITLAEWD